MTPWIALFFACGTPEAPTPPPPPAVAVAEPRTVAGPWTAGAHPALAADGDEVQAVWVEADVLRWSRSGDRGATWDPPEAVASDVIAGDGGQALPALVVVGEVPMVAYAAANRPWLAVRGHGEWERRALSTAERGAGVLLDLAVVDGRPLVVWLDSRRDPDHHVQDVYAWWDGQEEPVWTDGADGVCMCCRPAAGVVDGRPAVAFRDADGELREVRLLVRDDAGWTDRGVTAGGWSPGGCPADGPIFTSGGDLVVSDGRSGQRRLYRRDVALAAADDVQMLQPRPLGDELAWVEATAGASSLVAAGRVLATTPGRLEPGDPVRVGDEWWIPWQGEAATVTSAGAR